MVPQNIQNQLNRLRSRERFLQILWGTARWASIIAAALLVACLLDFSVDRFRETPRWLRVALRLFTVVALLSGGLYFLLRPLIQKLRDEQLALWVEEKHPGLRHRLISAVQLNREGIALGGMSRELIQVMTKEAESQAAKIDFPGVADHERAKKSLMVMAPIALLVALPFLLWPDFANALVARHFGSDVRIPRDVQLEHATDTKIWPKGEKLTLEFVADHKKFDPNEEGNVVVSIPDFPADFYKLKVKLDADGSPARTPEGRYIYATEVAGASVDFKVSATLGDGRTAEPATVKIVSRPVVTEQLAFVQLPDFCGVKPDGGRYETPQGRGDITGIQGSTARVVIRTQKPVSKAWLEIFGPAKWDPEKEAEEQGPEQLKRRVALPISEKDFTVLEEQADGSEHEKILREKTRWGQATFDFYPGDTAYLIHVEDEHGFRNVPPVRRSLRIIKEDAPQVVLLKNYFLGPNDLKGDETLEDYEATDAPVPLGSPLRIPYLAMGPYGLGKARVLYRVIKKTESGEAGTPDSPWISLWMTETTFKGAPKNFDERRGVFLDTKDHESVGFYAVPSLAPDLIPGRRKGGGRYHLATTGLIDDSGKKILLAEGDKIEYCVEVYADKYDDANDPKRPRAKSESRVQTLVSLRDFAMWQNENFQERERLQKIDRQQRLLFEKTSTGP